MPPWAGANSRALPRGPTFRGYGDGGWITLWRCRNIANLPTRSLTAVSLGLRPTMSRHLISVATVRYDGATEADNRACMPIVSR